MPTKELKIVLPSAVTDTKGLRKLEHYYGIEFVRGASNQGGDNGYHRMIGDASLLKEMRFHNQIKIASVKDAQIVNVLNPTNWRQTESGASAVLDGTDSADIMQVHTDGVYAIIGGSNATYERFIVSDRPFTYDGDVAKYYPAYGETPDYATLLNGAMRSIRNEGVIGTQAAGKGVNHSDSSYGTGATGAGFPRTTLSRNDFERYARSKNTDSNANKPYTNISNQDLELTAAFMFIEFRTKQLCTALGYGISSNAAPTAGNWGKVTGFRMTNDGGATYRYLTFGGAMYVDGIATNMWEILNGSCPITKMFEAQLAVSDGSEIEIVNDSDGNAVQGKSQGVMTGIWTKKFTFDIRAAATSGGEVSTWKVDAVLRIPIWRGRTRLWGHLFQRSSGYELLKYISMGGELHHIAYRSPSIDALVTDIDEAVYTSEGNYAFEETYEKVGELPTATGASVGFWATKMLALNGISTAIGGESGGSASTHESTYFFAGNGGLATSQCKRFAVSFGGGANEASCGLRYANGSIALSSATSAAGSGFRVELMD